MKVAALISGGKDSCFNMMIGMAEGHEIVALANLRPEIAGELDSYMYQTVGHTAIDLYADAMELPLYAHTIKGSSLSIGRDYMPKEGDEVEDLFQLLSQIKTEMNIEAVSVGAIMSDYQRVRVENVCQRLGLKVLAFLWRRNQEDLLKEMIDCDLKAIIIKVAAMGLLPNKHLGMELKDIFPHMVQMREKYGLNECGEGGEYETFVYDCPLFKKSIVIEETELVIHSDDAFAPVGYLNLKKCRLQDKPGHSVQSFLKNVDKLPISTTSKWLAKHASNNVDDICQSECSESYGINATKQILPVEDESEVPPFFATDGSNFQVSGITATHNDDSDVSRAAVIAMESLKDCIEKLGHDMSELLSVSLYVGSMSNYVAINAVYKRYFVLNPPVRICIQVSLPPKVLFQLDCQGSKKEDADDRKTMHVQSLSHWAPANIGPFSQAILTQRKVFVAGTTALVPSTLNLIEGGITVQSKLALIHLMEKIVAMSSTSTLSHCPLINCYVTCKEHISVAKKTFASKIQETIQTYSGSASLSPAVQYCVVPRLPQGALVEWQSYSWSFSDEDENIHSSHFTKTFADYSFTVECNWLQQFFSCKICVHSPECDDVVDIKGMAYNLLKEYNNLATPNSKALNKDLAKIFYPAGRVPRKELVEGFTQNLPDVAKDRLPTFSFIPVTCLERENDLFVWCQ